MTTETPTTTATWRCPTCRGPHLYGWTWQHHPRCPIQVAEDTTQAADTHRMAAAPHRIITRPATATEILLARTLGRDIADQALTTVRTSPEGRHRTIGGHEPETP